MRLRRAREEQGLSMQNVADSLCLRVSVVRDLEERAFEDRPLEAFTRGYIRAYAKKVGLNGEALLLEYTGQSNGNQPLKLQSFSKKTRHRKQDHRVMTLTWAILSVAIGVTIAWWWQSPSDEVSVLSQQNSAEAGNKLLDKGLTFVNPALANDNGSAAPVTTVVKMNDTVATAMPVSAQTNVSAHANSALNEFLAKPAADAQAQVVQTATAASQTAAPQVATNETTVQPAAAAPVSQLTAAPVQASAPAEPAPQPAKPSPRSAQASAKQHAAPQSKSLFTMSFVADCWVDIVDAKGKKLLTGIKSRGDVVELNGQPPIKVVLGAPAAVRLTYKGKLIDLSQYPPKRVARLSLPMSE
ncbi:MAG: cytoskeleton protein RodZ [Enterovibrio sp.]